MDVNDGDETERISPCKRSIPLNACDLLIPKIQIRPRVVLVNETHVLIKTSV